MCRRTSRVSSNLRKRWLHLFLLIQRHLVVQYKNRVRMKRPDSKRTWVFCLNTYPLIDVWGNQGLQKANALLQITKERTPERNEAHNFGLYVLSCSSVQLTLKFCSPCFSDLFSRSQRPMRLLKNILYSFRGSSFSVLWAKGEGLLDCCELFLFSSSLVILVVLYGVTLLPASPAQLGPLLLSYLF